MWNCNGKQYARVSDILAAFVDFNAIPPDVLERKAALGTRIHDAINHEIQGDLVVVPVQEVGYFQSFERWRSALCPVFLETEKRMYCDQKMLTGCIDALVKFEGEKIAVLVDWKTSVSESPAWILQAHLYHYLLNVNDIQIAPRFLWVKLDKHGLLPRVYQYKFQPTVHEKCMQAIDAFWRKTVVHNS